jgi:superfamily II DNA or RNA helicase
MADSLHLLFDEPELLEALQLWEPEFEFPPGALKRAHAYLDPGIITKITAEPLGGDYGRYEDDENDFPVGRGITVSARVLGSRRRPYTTSVDFFFSEVTGAWEAEYFCSCPVGTRCKHAAALMMCLSTLARKRAGGETSSATRIPRGVSDWLRSLETPVKPVGPQETKPKYPSQQKFLAYCLETSRIKGRFRFSLRPATRTKSGAVRIETSEARSDMSNPPGYFADEDLRPWIAYLRHPRIYDGWASRVYPEGAQGASLIAMALETGRFFLITEPDFHRPTEKNRSIQRGGPLTVNPGWRMMPSGNARPVIEGLPEGFHIIHVDPPVYLDVQSGTLGELRSDHPLHLLKQWDIGPELPADIVDQVSTRIASIPGSTLPAPVSIPTTIREGLPPAPHFTVTRLSASIGGMPQDFVVGRLSFQYGDSPLFTHLPSETAESRHVEMRDGTRVVWMRDPATESAMVEKLRASGLTAFTDIISRHLLHHSLRPTFVPEDPQPSPALAWLRCLGSPEMDRLREEGWNIVVEPKAGLTAHDVGDFLPAIEAETDHGIDWFRFDVSFEIDGVKRSLIPLIAQAIEKGFPPATTPDLPEWITIPCENPADGFIRLPARRFLEIVDQVRHLFHGREPGEGGFVLDRLAAAGIANHFGLASSKTMRALAELGRSLQDIHELPQEKIPASVKATLRPYQHEGFRWLRFLAKHQLNGILADDMGLGKTLQTLTHLAAEHAGKPGKPSLVVAPTSVVPNWAAEAEKFTPRLKVRVHHGLERSTRSDDLRSADVVVTSYPLLHRDIGVLAETDWHCVILDEAQHIKNPKSITAQAACALTSKQRLCLSGTPMENHLGELWSLMRFLMPGYLPDEKTFNAVLRKPIERDRSADAQNALNRRVSPLILRRTKDQVATDLPPKTELIHHIELTKKQVDLYESVRASMDKRVREAIAAKGLAKSHIIVLDALLKLRQICCHPRLLKTPAAEKVTESAKLDFLTDELLPQLLEEGRRILLFSQFTSMLALIEAHLEKQKIPFLKLTGQTKDRASLVKQFQSGEVPVFLISLKAGGTGLNLTAADTVIHYDPWWNPAAENQATDRAHRIGQSKPVFVHKLVCRGSIEDRILELQKHKSALVKALLSEETTSLRIDSETLSHLLEPIV